MGLKADLLNLLMALPEVDTILARKAFIVCIEFENLEHYLDWTGSNNAFFIQLIEKVSSGGKNSLLAFLANLPKAPQVGIDRHARIIALRNMVDALDGIGWRNEFAVALLTDKLTAEKRITDPIIYICSDLLPFQDEYKAVERAVKSLINGLTPLHIIVPSPSISIASRMTAIDDSNLFVGIFNELNALRMDAEVSALVNSEYRYALQRNIPRLVYTPESQRLDDSFLEGVRQEPNHFFFSSPKSIFVRITTDIPRLVKDEILPQLQSGMQYIALDPINSPSTRNKSTFKGTSLDERKVNDTLQLGSQEFLVREPIDIYTFDTYTLRVVRAWENQATRDVVLKEFTGRDNQHTINPVLPTLTNEARTRDVLGQQCTHLPRTFVILPLERSLWVVTEWIKGSTLRSLYPQDGPLPIAEIIDLIIDDCLDACDALSALHQANLYHLWVNPDTIVRQDTMNRRDNALRKGRGAVLIELPAKNKESATSGREQRLLAPEQISSSPLGLSIGPSTDVFGIGATLYALLTHRTPSIIRDTPTPLATHSNHYVPDTLARVIQRALAWRPAERFQNIEQLTEGLQLAQQELRRRG